VLWQHVFQFVVRVVGNRTLHSSHYTHHKLKHLLPQHRITYNDVALLIVSTKV